MKKVFVVLASVLFLASAQAQEGSPQGELNVKVPSESSRIRLLPIAGFSSFSIVGKDVDKSVARETGFTGGLLADFGSGRFRFESGLLYFQAGFRRPVVSDISIKTSIDYLGIPLALKYQFYDAYGDQRDGLYARAGLMPAFVLSSSSKYAYSNYKLSEPEEPTDLNKQDVLGLVGLGAIWSRYELPIFVDGTFYSGLTKVAADMEAYNMGFTVTAGVGFDL